MTFCQQNFGDEGKPNIGLESKTLLQQRYAGNWKVIYAQTQAYPKQTFENKQKIEIGGKCKMYKKKSGNIFVSCLICNNRIVKNKNIIKITPQVHLFD